MAPTKAKPKKGSTSGLDANGDGQISASEAAAGGGDISLGGLGLGDGPGGTTTGKGAPLLPYQTSGDFDQSGLTFQDNSMVGRAQAAATGQPQGRVGVRYFESDTLGPLQWSPELRAQLQKAMYQIGLYGNAKVTLGSWGADDQGALAELMKQANVDGRTWYEQLAFWKANPPQDLLAKIAATKPKLPTIQVSNPLDIRAAAAKVSQDVTGGGDQAFVKASAPAYQATEVAAQQGMIDDQAAGGGGTITQQASPENYLADKLRREKPIDTNGYSFLKTFDQFANFIGGNGA